MEEKVNPWKANLTNGLILGLVGIMYSLVMYFMDLTLNPTQGYIFIVVQIALLFFLLKSFRDNSMHGQITYGQAVGAGVVIILYYSLISAVFSYVLFTIIDPGLVAKQMAVTEQGMVDKGLTQEQIDAGLAFSAKLMKPAIMSIWGFVISMIWGTIISLLISIFIRKEGNPLIETPQN